MGLFDYVHFKMDCPICGEKITGFQSKSGVCDMTTLEPDDLSNFYCPCGKCDAWIAFERPTKIHKLRDKPLGREEVEAMGFVMKVTKKT